MLRCFFHKLMLFILLFYILRRVGRDELPYYDKVVKYKEGT